MEPSLKFKLELMTQVCECFVVHLDEGRTRYCIWRVMLWPENLEMGLHCNTILYLIIKDSCLMRQLDNASCVFVKKTLFISYSHLFPAMLRNFTDRKFIFTT